VQKYVIQNLKGVHQRIIWAIAISWSLSSSV